MEQNKKMPLEFCSTYRSVHFSGAASSYGVCGRNSSSRNGYNNLLVFRGHAPHILRAVDDTDGILEKKRIVKCTKMKPKSLWMISNSNARRISKKISQEGIDSTLANLL